MKTIKDIKQSIRKLKVESSDQIHNRVLDKLLIAMDKSKNHTVVNQPKVWRTIMNKPIAKLVAAAVIIVAVLIGINHFGGSIDGTSVAWGEVAKKVEKIQTFICQRKDSQTNTEKEKTTESEMVLYTSSEYGNRIDSYKDGEIYISTYTLPKKKTVITIIPAAKRYSRYPLTDKSLREMKKKGPREVVSRFLSSNYKKLGRKKINEIEVEGIEVNDPNVVSTNFPIENLVARLWVDVETDLPVILETEIITGGGKTQIKTVMDNFQWNPELDPDMFEPDIPVDYVCMAGDLIEGPRMKRFDDGTMVTLSEDAKIRLYGDIYKRGFEHISGEIEVSVVKGKEEFHVSTKFGDVKALGTVFKMNIVKADSIDMLAVEVKEGSVEVSNPHGSKVVKTNQVVTIVRDQAPYDFRNDKNLPSRLIERIDAMLTAMDSCDKKAYIANYNIKAFYDLVKGNIKFDEHRDWFSGMSEDDAKRIIESGADVNSPDELAELAMAGINLRKTGKHYIQSVILDDDGKHATARCVEEKDKRRYTITTPQWTFFDGDWWQTDD